MFGVLRPEACAPIAHEPNLKMVLTSLGSLWIVNRTTDAIELQAGELFGFNTGAYVEVQSGLRRDIIFPIISHVPMQRVYSSYHILYAYKYNIYNIYKNISIHIYIYVFIGICILKMKHVNLKSINLHIHIHTITHIYISVCAFNPFQNLSMEFHILCNVPVRPMLWPNCFDSMAHQR